jgi:hypothetical protein
MPPPPPIVETRRKIINVVGILVVKHRNVSGESNCNVIVQKNYLPKKLSTEGGKF